MLSAIEQGHAYVRDVATINGHNCVVSVDNQCKCSYCGFYIYHGKDISSLAARPCGSSYDKTIFENFIRLLRENFYEGFY